MLHYDRDASVVKSQLSMIAQFPSVVSSSPEIVSCGGVGVDVIKILDMSSSSKNGVHYPFHLKRLKWEKLLRKPSYSAMCRIFLFPFLKSIPAPLLRSLDLKWVQSTLYLRKGGRSFVNYSKTVTIKRMTFVSKLLTNSR